MPKPNTMLIIGASRGLGLALAEQFCQRGWAVIATERSRSPGLAALRETYPDRLEIEQLEMNDLTAVRALRARVKRSLDLLFVNAGITRATESTPNEVADTDYTDLMLTNALNPMRVVETFESLVRPEGAIAVMSSELGSVAHNPGFWELYSSSKAALNMLMKCFSERHPNDPRALLLVAPGWIRTEMGGQDATYSIEECIPRVADTVVANLGRPGLRFVDRFNKILPW
jgi:NAD(P)-dependent dehydrogenase (short-subunit alcohol dehydrogenase family)